MNPYGIAILIFFNSYGPLNKAWCSEAQSQGKFKKIVCFLKRISGFDRLTAWDYKTIKIDRRSIRIDGRIIHYLDSYGKPLPYYKTLDSLLYPTVKQLGGAVKQAVELARKEFEKDPTVLAPHLRGELGKKSDGTVVSGGLHVAQGLDELTRERSMDFFGRGWEDRFGEIVKSLSLDPSRFSSPDDLKAAVQNGSIRLGGPTEVDGVVHLWLRVEMLGSKNFKATVASAREGISPIAGKSLFPINWAPEDIIQGIKRVLSNPQSLVTKWTILPDGSIRNLILQGEYKGIKIAVALWGDKPVSAYPLWTQSKPEDLSLAKREAEDEAHRAKRVLERTLEKNGMSRDAVTNIKPPMPNLYHQGLL